MEKASSHLVPCLLIKILFFLSWGETQNLKIILNFEESDLTKFLFENFNLTIIDLQRILR